MSIQDLTPIDAVVDCWVRVHPYISLSQPHNLWVVFIARLILMDTAFESNWLMPFIAAYASFSIITTSAPSAWFTRRNTERTAGYSVVCLSDCQTSRYCDVLLMTRVLHFEVESAPIWYILQDLTPIRRIAGRDGSPSATATAGF